MIGKVQGNNDKFSYRLILGLLIITMQLVCTCRHDVPNVFYFFKLYLRAIGYTCNTYVYSKLPTSTCTSYTMQYTTIMPFLTRIVRRINKKTKIKTLS